MLNECWTSEEEALLCYANSGASLDFSPNTAVKFYLQDKQMQEEWVQRCTGEAVHMLPALLMAFQVHIDLLLSAEEEGLACSCSSEEDTAQLKRAGRWARRGGHPCHEMLTCEVVPARANQPQGSATSIICTLFHGIPALFSGLGLIRCMSADDVISCSWVRGHWEPCRSCLSPLSLSGDGFWMDSLGFLWLKWGFICLTGFSWKPNYMPWSNPSPTAIHWESTTCQVTAIKLCPGTLILPQSKPSLVL